MSIEDRTLQERFEDFHASNPQVFAALEDMVRSLRAAGRTRVGIEMLMNQLRWQSMISTRGDDFKINQNYASRYARLLVAEHPEWDGMFEFRTLRAA